MLKPQHFTALAIATGLSVITAAIMYATTNRWSAGKIEGAKLVPGFDRQDKAITAIEILRGDKRMTLERQDANWKIKERSGYLANPERVRAMLNALAAAELVDPKTASKDKHKQLELEDPATKDAKSRGVRVLDAKGKPLADVVLGKTRFDAFGAGKAGTYVRRNNEAQTWLATGEPRGGTEIKDWIATTVFELDQAKFAKIQIEHPGDTPLIIEKGDGKEQKFKLDKMPDGQKLKQGVTIDQLAQGFASFELEDVRKLEGTPAGDTVSVMKLEADGGLGVTFRVRREGDASWLSLQAAGKDGDAKKQADDINTKSSGWEFKLPQWKIDQIGKRRADLFETS